MATVYSLVCWGGRTGKSVTASNSSGLIFTTSAAHGLRDALALQFTATTLPGNVAASTTYYAKVLSSTTFSIYTEAALTNRVAWSSAGSAVYAKSKTMIDYFSSYSGRWGSSGSERCYDSFSSWNTARASALSTDVEILEIGESFTLIDSPDLWINVPSGASRITTLIDGVRSAGWHKGEIPDTTPTISQGFILQNSGTTGAGLILNSANCAVEGFVVQMTGGGGMYMLRLNGFSCSAQNMIAVGPGYDTHTGIRVDAAGCSLKNCLSVGWSIGIRINYGQYGLVVANCTTTKNSIGMYGDYADVSVYNCISVGNVTDWGTFNLGTTTRASNNAGLSGQAWITGSSPRFTVSTSDFANWGASSLANTDDFRPANSSAPQVDTGVLFYGAISYDIADAERPNYNNGGAEAFDIGCYEFDHGYGLKPTPATLTLTGLAVGTDVVIRAAGTSTVLASVDAVSDTSWQYVYQSAHNVDIDVIKPGLVLVPFRGLALTSVDSSLPVSQLVDRNYA